jgi:hypothetical protein
MADFNVILDAGDYQNGIVTVVNEIPVGSTNKIEWKRQLAAFELDRVEPSSMPKPTNYGFIPQTLDEDGDELDVLIVTDQPLPTGVRLQARVWGEVVPYLLQKARRNGPKRLADDREEWDGARRGMGMGMGMMSEWSWGLGVGPNGTRFADITLMADRPPDLAPISR